MAATAAPSAEDPARRWLAVPGPVRSLFKLFPLRIYDREPLPCRAPDPLRTIPALYVFAHPGDARDHDVRDPPSFNPSCLRWQTLLRVAAIPVRLVPSNNHASPSGALPFLLPPTTSQSSSAPLTGGAILDYARDNSPRSRLATEPPSSRLDAYRSLLAQAIRPFYLHALYLNPLNEPLLRTLYLPNSALLSPTVHATLTNSAASEILRSTLRATISPDHLFSEASDALSALSTLLDERDWFSSDSRPGPFDAEVFAYTWLMLDGPVPALAWPDDVLARCLREYPNLVAHRDRVYEWCWGGERGC